MLSEISSYCLHIPNIKKFVVRDMTNGWIVDYGLGCSQGKTPYDIETYLINPRRLHGKGKPFDLAMKRETSILSWSSTIEVCLAQLYGIPGID